VFEADLLMYILDVPFSLDESYFGTCFNAFDSKVAQTLKHLITLVTTKLHPDYLADYQEIINRYLEILHKRSGFLDSVYNLPKSI